MRCNGSSDAKGRGIFVGLEPSRSTGAYKLWAHEVGVDAIDGQLIYPVRSFFETADISLPVQQGINKALQVVRDSGAASVPMHLRGTGYSGASELGHGVGYKYPHDSTGAVIEQQYLPETITDTKFYAPKALGREVEFASLWARLRRIIRGK